MRHLSVKSWSEFQHYGKRNPPWIKVHNALLADYDFTHMTDVAKAHLLLIWVLASRCNNKIRYDEPWIRAQIGAQSKINLDNFIESGWLILSPDDSASSDASTDASTVLATCSGNENQVGSVRRVEESREEESRGVVPAPLAGLPGITLNDKTQYFVTAEDLTLWTDLYPAVDVEHTIRKIAGWNDSNPSKRKTKGGIRKHINDWLARDQDGAGKQTGGTSAGNSSVIDAITDAATK